MISVDPMSDEPGFVIVVSGETDMREVLDAITDVIDNYNYEDIGDGTELLRSIEYGITSTTGMHRWGCNAQKRDPFALCVCDRSEK